MSIFWRTIRAVLGPLLFIYVLIPVILFLFPGIMKHVFYLNFVKLPFTDYSNLTYHKVASKGRNFYLQVPAAAEATGDGDVRLGVWHVLPRSLSDKYGDRPLSSDEMERCLGVEPFPIIVYLHGNSFDRTGDHRCKLYNVLSNMDFHVLAFDYRGYGDSTGVPTEAGLVQDASAVYDYAKRLAGDNPVFIWGHSMGTGVATKTAMDLSVDGRPPVGLILESPFNNLRDVVTHHPFAVPFRWLPWFDWMIVRPMQRSGIDMRTDERIKRVDSPILILHAHDDLIIPHKLAARLTKVAQDSGKDVTFVEFAKERGFAHKYILRAEELATVIGAFVEKCSGTKDADGERHQTAQELLDDLKEEVS